MVMTGHLRSIMSRRVLTGLVDSSSQSGLLR
jgi:hypothetical protein